MFKFIFIFIFCYSLLFSQDADVVQLKKNKNPYLASILNLIPGLGYIYLGEGKIASQHFISTIFLARMQYDATLKNGYIPDALRGVDFNFIDILNQDFRKSDNSSNLPVYYFEAYDMYIDEKLNFIRPEPEIQKRWRLIKNGNYFDWTLFEFNPLLQYGPYERYNSVTAKADYFGNMLAIATQYSLYAGFRDAGGINGGRGNKETFNDLFQANFQFTYLKDIKILIPFLGILVGSSIPTQQNNIQILSSINELQVEEKTVLVNSGFHKNGYGVGKTVFDAFSAGISEEAFFRGTLYNGLANFTGKITSAILISLLFGSGHLYQGIGGAASATLFGLYSTYIYEYYNKDLRPIIFLHTWWNMFTISAQIRRTYKEDPRVEMNQREVNLSPIFYTYKF